MEQDFRTIQNYGKNNLLEHFKKNKSYSNKNTVSGIGDDAAVIDLNEKEYLLASSSTFVEGVHFDLSYTHMRHLGYKIVSAAVSNILAMNGRPTSMLINLAIPNRQSVQMILDLYEGIYAAGNDYKIEVLGGDTKPNHNNIVLTITVNGIVDKNKITFRKNAGKLDAICVTGDLGAAFAGLRILTREKQYWLEHKNENIQPDFSDYQYVIKKQLYPAARIDVVKKLNELNILPTSMIDLTQGIINDVSELASASDKGVYLYQAALPIAIETRQVANEMEEDVDRYALFGGEDLELMFTLPEKDVELLAGKFKDFSVIGRMVPKQEGFSMQTAEGDVISFDDLS